MTAFVKENFSWDGMYLMYKGEFEGAKLMTMFILTVTQVGKAC